MSDQDPGVAALWAVIARLTAPGAGRESGATVEEIATEFHALAGHRWPAGALRDRVAALLLQPRAAPLFRQGRRPDGCLAFLNAPPAAADPIFGDLPPPLFAEPFADPLPATAAELRGEAARLAARKAELLREEQQLLRCHRLLLQNPACVQEEAERLTAVLLNMRDVQGIVDYKVRQVLESMRLHGGGAN
jgi:hypothetical protein